MHNPSCSYATYLHAALLERLAHQIYSTSLFARVQYILQEIGHRVHFTTKQPCVTEPRNQFGVLLHVLRSGFSLIEFELLYERGKPILR